MKVDNPQAVLESLRSGCVAFRKTDPRYPEMDCQTIIFEFCLLH